MGSITLPKISHQLPCIPHLEGSYIGIDMMLD